jgi:hypothetical protein
MRSCSCWRDGALRLGEAVPETRSSPGYLMVRELQRRGDIDSFKAIKPADGWETEYSLESGAAHLRFRGGEMGFDVDRSDGDLKRAIEAEARREGFGQSDSAASSAAAAASAQLRPGVLRKSRS